MALSAWLRKSRTEYPNGGGEDADRNGTRTGYNKAIA